MILPPMNLSLKNNVPVQASMAMTGGNVSALIWNPWIWSTVQGWLGGARAMSRTSQPELLLVELCTWGSLGSKFPEILFERASKTGCPQTLYSLVSWTWCFSEHTGYPACLSLVRSRVIGMVLIQTASFSSSEESYLSKCPSFPAQLLYVLFWWTEL